MSHEIPLVKVKFAPREVLMPAIEKVLYSGQIAEGERVYEFERAFSEKYGLVNSIGVSSGTAALHIALMLCGVDKTSEVISTPMTAEPTNTSIMYCGAKVIWADVDAESGNMDPESVRKVITNKTRAIVVVHYAGYPAKIDALKSIAQEFGIPLIEDCAHALGATYNGRPIGTFGDFGIFSFQAIKHMTTIDGGILSIANKDHIELAKKLRWFGMLKGVPRTEINMDVLGYKYNMNNVTAAVGLVQLQYIDAVIQRHRENGQFFDDKIRSIKGLNYGRSEPCADSTYWLYTLLTPDSIHLEKLLNEAGVRASKLHRPNNLHKIFSESKVLLPNLDLFYKKLLHIPCGWWVTDEDREKILVILERG